MTKRNQIQIFNEKKVRTVWDSDTEEWYFSVIDVVEILTESLDPSAYWRKFKQRLKAKGNETVANCHRLKLQAADRKIRLADVATSEQENPTTMREHVKAAKSGGNVAKAARAELESKLGRSVISSAKASDYLEGKRTPRQLKGEKGR